MKVRPVVLRLISIFIFVHLVAFVAWAYSWSTLRGVSGGIMGAMQWTSIRVFDFLIAPLGMFPREWLETVPRSIRMPLLSLFWTVMMWLFLTALKKRPNKAPEPTPRPVMIPAEPGITPGRVVAHL